ncbi:hypothetical protein [Vitiosangium sp. GDMCC 1.1324]|uniref:hypothetical protein n=1 Tax=Vitiosangium sp. (strain GDMCC 1.1324) TaxID=2138576 RepID=UPI000D336D99|nr:hypothetical protein [Vitiosangium sp. GDMCC 1.1324]PTL75108.1 hypothetical protein DAT35_56700 [Vitiosangium sp. GDMCC 1.1324]
MLAVARLFAQSRPATGLDRDWVVEALVYAILLSAGLILIFRTIRAQGRLQDDGTIHRLSIKELFTFKTNAVGLFALVGVLLVGAALFPRFKNYRGELDAAQTKQRDLHDQVIQERERRKQQESVSMLYLLDFSEEEAASPGDLADVKVSAKVYSTTRPEPQPVEVIAQPEKASIRAIVKDLHVGDNVILQAKDGKQTWTSDSLEVPSVPVQMYKSEAEEHAGGRP